MNPRQLANYFDRISVAADAVPRLRSFILDLAVRGKLVEQDSRDEPASELVERVKTEWKRLFREGIITYDKLSRDIQEAEKPYSIPHNWQWIRLGECLELINGRAFKPTDWLSSGLPIVRIQNLNSENAPFNYCDESIVDSRHIVASGCFLISWSGTPGTSFGAFIWKRGKAALNQHIFKCIQIGRAYYDQFLRIAINGRLDEMIAKAHGGVGLQHITKGKLENLPLSLPPAAEQHRIVDKVNELMALCDRFEAARDEREIRRDRLTASSHYHLNNGANAEAFRRNANFYISHLPSLTNTVEQIKQLRQTILNLAVRAKLITQEAADEPASELLKRIQADKGRLVKSGAVSRLLHTSPIRSDQMPSAIPESWEWVRIGDLLLGDSQNGYSKKPDDAPDGVPILRISAGTVRKDRIVAEEEHKLVGAVSAKQREQYGLQPGDLLACRFNGNRGFVGRLSLYVGYLGIDPIYPDKLIRLRLLPGFVLPKLVSCFAASSVVRKDIDSYCATTAGNWGISASNLKEVKIPLPPLAEQYRIVAKVDQLMAVCERLESQLTSAHSESSRLLEAVLHDALHSSTLVLKAGEQ